MAKYMIHFNYTSQGIQGLMKEGASSRREAARQLVESLGGKVEAFYFAFGHHAGVLMVDMPDNVSTMSAVALVNASGAATTETVVLLTPEEVDQAFRKGGTYRPPGA